MSDEQSERRSLIRILRLAVPAVSFGSIVLNLLLFQLGLITDIGPYGAGQFVGALLLSIMALLMPRKDIVSLLAPVYALLIFIVPLDLKPNLLTQILFAASITVLVIRLEHGFSQPPTKRTFEPIDDDEEV